MSKETEDEDGGGGKTTKEERETISEISNFAAKIGDTTGGNFIAYVYRVIKDEETGRQKRPLVKKYVGVEPDPGEIAEKFRGGDYLVTFIWKVKGEQKSRSFMMEVDGDAFPPIAKGEENALVPAGVSNLSEPMQLQLAMIRGITEAMKAGYSAGSGAVSGRVAPAQSDPLDMFDGMMETMQNTFARAMTMQNRIYERVYNRNMEKAFGLLPEDVPEAAPVEDEAGIIGKYAPVVKEVVDGLKYVVGLFGGSPQKWPGPIVDKVKKDEKFRAILKDPKALAVIGAALRREFGINKANEYMKTFGVRMEVRQGKTSQTPDIPGSCGPAGPQQQTAEPAALPAPAKQGEGFPGRLKNGGGKKKQV